MNNPSACQNLPPQKRNSVYPGRICHRSGCYFALANLLRPGAAAACVLTWQGDTSTTITVNYQTMKAAESSTVYYDTKSHRGAVSEYAFHPAGTSHQIPILKDGRSIHWVELTGLKPGTIYYFIAGDPTNGFSAERKFRTIANDEPIRFVDGGDMGTGADLAGLLKAAARQEPRFAVVGGDLSYANDAATNYTRWDVWLDGWEKHMVTPKGYTIPMVLAIGNHGLPVRGNIAHECQFLSGLLCATLEYDVLRAPLRKEFCALYSGLGTPGPAHRGASAMAG